MMKILSIYGVCLVSLCLIDMLWIGVIAKSFYFKHLGYLFAEKFKILPIIFFYLLYTGGLLFFVVNPSLSSGSVLRGVLMGLFFGLTAYTTYDLTNHALLKNWPWVVTIVDMLWGGLLSGVISGIGIIVGRSLFS